MLTTRSSIVLFLLAAASPAHADEIYARAVIARPLTLPSRIAMLGADATGNHDLSALGGAPIIGYGITDELEVQVPYAFATRDFEARGALDVDLGYALLRGALGGKLEVIARARAGYDMLAEDARPVLLGLHAQYNVTDRLALISGAPGTEQVQISPDVVFSLPLGIGVQAGDTIYLQLDTKLVSDTTLIVRDAVPATLTVLCNVVPALDVQAALGTDLMTAPGDNLAFLVGARFYLL